MAERIYFLQGNNTYMLNRMAREIVDGLDLDPFNVTSYDLEDASVHDVLEDLMTVSFFGSGKAVTLKSAHLLDKLGPEDAKAFSSYLEKPNPDAVLVIVNKGPMPSSSVISKAIKTYAYIEKVSDIPVSDYPALIVKMCGDDGFSISPRTAEILVSRAGADIDLVMTEITKLKVYAADSKEILGEDVIALVSRNLDENVYDLTNALVSGNRQETYRIFRDLVDSNEDPIRIMNTVASKIRELIQVKTLLSKGFSQDRIAEHLGVKSGRAYYMVKNARAMSLPSLERHLDKLADLDYRIKSGKTDKRLGVEFYVLGV
jgi:DNA polymerase III subunit delta